MNEDRKYLRTASLILSNGEKGIELSDLHFTFRVEAAQQQSPNTAEIIIFNPSEETRQRILKKGEFNQVMLQVGYRGSQQGMIFSGTISQLRYGKSSSKDTFVTIFGVDGDLLYNATVVSAVVPGGSTADEEIDVLAGSTPNGKLGYVPTLEGLNPDQSLIRDKVMFGMFRQVARQIARKQNLSWSVNGGKVDFLPYDSYKAGEAVKLNSLTGLVGIPEQTDAGIKVRCLIDPKIQVGGLIELNNKEITQTQIQDVVMNLYAGQGVLYAVTQMDGLYMVFSIDYSGDSRGNDWYMDIICLAVNRDTKKVVPKL